MHAHDFVPATADGMRPQACVQLEEPCSEQCAFYQLRLDMFDSPEMESTSPEVLLERFRVNGSVLALSRYFDQQVRFTLGHCACLQTGAQMLS